MMKVLEETIKRAQQGDPIAIDEVLSEVLSFLEDFIGAHVVSIADRDDLAQEALIEIYRGLSKYQIGTSFDDWVSVYAWQFLERYQSGEYFAGKRKRSSAGNTPPAWREISFSEWLGDTDFEDVEGEINPDRVIS